jgi:hypothetical protein
MENRQIAGSHEVEALSSHPTDCFHAETWQRFGNVKRRKPCKTVRQDAGKYMANQQDRDFGPDSGSAYQGPRARRGFRLSVGKQVQV